MVYNPLSDAEISKIMKNLSYALCLQRIILHKKEISEAELITYIKKAQITLEKLQEEQS